jgi:hypothetical protein
MSSINNIKISELDQLPTSITSEDFFPLVDSSSMTTFRVPIGKLGAALTSSGYSAGSLYASSSLVSSRSLGSEFASGSLFASRSLSASHALLSDNVSLSGNQYYFPFWTGSIINGGLDPSNGSFRTPLYVSFSRTWNYDGTVVIDPYRAFLYMDGPTIDANRLDFHRWGWYNYRANTFKSIASPPASGIMSPWPIVSSTFTGTDQSTWFYATESIASDQGWFYTTKSWQGNTRTGGWVDIGNYPGALIDTFNGKWVRLVSTSVFSEVPPRISSGSSYGESVNGGINGLAGRVRININTPAGTGLSATNQYVDMVIQNQWLGGGIDVQITNASQYGRDLIRKLRLSKWVSRSDDPTLKQYQDPMVALDIFIDNLTSDDAMISITAQSWGGIRFLSQPNINPDLLYDTASYFGHTGDPKTSEYLIFPPTPGHYSTLGTYQPYLIQGNKVQINPNRNEITESAYNLSSSTNNLPYSLWVSGTISTQNYFIENLQGRTAQYTVYNEADQYWYRNTYAGGILVASATSSVPVLTGGGNVVSASYSSTASYVNLRYNPGIPRAWALCVSTGSSNLVNTSDPTYHWPGSDDHWMHIQAGYNVRAVTKRVNSDDPTLSIDTTTIPSSFPASPDITQPYPTSERIKKGTISTLANGFTGMGNGLHWLVTLNTTMSSTNYMVMGSAGGRQYNGYAFVTMFPEARRTTTQFTLSCCFATPNFATYNSTDNIKWFNFAVYENPDNIGLSYPGFA